MNNSKNKKVAVSLAVGAVLISFAVINLYPAEADADSTSIAAEGNDSRDNDSKGAGQEDSQIEEKPMMAVTAVSAMQSSWPVEVSAYGNIEAWQEAVVGSELGGYRIAEVLVEVGDKVSKGQTLAKIDRERIAVEYQQQEAELAAAKAALDEAKANAKRIQQLVDSGSLSSQEIGEYLTSEKSASAKLKAAEARLQLEKIRLSYVNVVATDDGQISSRSAQLGAIVGQGQELFKLIRQNRMEWRAEIDAQDLWKIKPGQQAMIALDSGAQITGTVRVADPKVNTKSRKALLYIDLPASANITAGTFAIGHINIEQSNALVLPSRAVVVRDGYSYVLELGKDGVVNESKVEVGRRVGDMIEIVSGLDATTAVVDKGAGFLADGDRVKVVDSSGNSLVIARNSQ